MKKILLICSIFLLGNQLINAQLAAGDIAFIGCNQDSGPSADEDDDFTFIVLTNISAGEVIYFTEQGVNINSMIWFANTEGHISWTAPAGGLSCGTIVHIYESVSSPGTFVTSSGTVSGVINGSNWNLSAGDQILAYQAASVAAAIGSCTFISGIHMEDDQANGETNSWTSTSYNATGVSYCHVPPGLTNGVDCISLFSGAGTPEKDNMRYTGTLTGLSSTLRSLINNPANWATDDITAYNISSGSYSPSVTCVAPCTDPTVPIITASVSPVCASSTTTLNIAGTLNDATQWVIYTGSCGGTLVGTTTTSSFVVTPAGPSTTYYVRGEGGCVTPGSCAFLTVNVTTVNNTITQNSGILTANQTGATYQWYECPSTLLSGETNQSFTPTVIGNYKVEITFSTCTVQSACENVTVLGAEDFENVTKFSIYPNPTSGLLNINTSFDGQFIIVNQLGQIVHSFKANSNVENVINVENLTNGIYFVKGINETQTNSRKLIIKK
jgi:hypothetical protein